jgi:hypothetical protein
MTRQADRSVPVAKVRLYKGSSTRVGRAKSSFVNGLACNKSKAGICP